MIRFLLFLVIANLSGCTAIEYGYDADEYEARLVDAHSKEGEIRINQIKYFDESAERLLKSGYKPEFLYEVNIDDFYFISPSTGEYYHLVRTGGTDSNISKIQMIPYFISDILKEGVVSYSDKAKLLTKDNVIKSKNENAAQSSVVAHEKGKVGGVSKSDYVKNHIAYIDLGDVDGVYDLSISDMKGNEWEYYKGIPIREESFAVYFKYDGYLSTSMVCHLKILKKCKPKNYLSPEIIYKSGYVKNVKKIGSSFYIQLIDIDGNEKILMSSDESIKKNGALYWENESYTIDTDINSSSPARFGLLGIGGSQFYKGKIPVYVKSKVKYDSVRILNIKEKFYQGIPLDPGEYIVEIYKKGFKKIREKVLFSADHITYTAEFDKSIDDFETKADALIKSGEYDAGIRLLEKSFENGNISGAIKIATLYDIFADNKNLSKDQRDKYFEASKLWYSLAAKKGDVFSKLNLSYIYKEGRGSTQKDQAMFLYILEDIVKRPYVASLDSDESRFAYGYAHFNLANNSNEVAKKYAHFKLSLWHLSKIKSRSQFIDADIDSLERYLTYKDNDKSINFILEVYNSQRGYY